MEGRERLGRGRGGDERRARLPLEVAKVRDGGVLEQRREDHHEARHQVDVDALQVRYLQWINATRATVTLNVITDTFNGPGREIGPACVSVCVCVGTFGINWHVRQKKYY